MLILIMLINFCCHSINHGPFDVQLLNKYYYGNDRRFANVFVRVENNTAIVDFIFVQKYPRKLLTDTLVFDPDQHKFIGRYSNLFLSNGKCYVFSNEELLIFGEKRKIKVSLNESYYKNNINGLKNYAVWHQYYEQYINNNNSIETKKTFQDFAERKQIKILLNNLKHEDFLKELEKFKVELELLKL